MSDSYLISDSDFHEINKRSKVDKFDLLISMIGTVGEVCFEPNQPNYAIKNVGLIKGSIAGTRVCYCINTEKWTEMKHIMNAFLNQDINSNDCC